MTRAKQSSSNLIRSGTWLISIATITVACNSSSSEGESSVASATTSPGRSPFLPTDADGNSTSSSVGGNASNVDNEGEGGNAGGGTSGEDDGDAGNAGGGNEGEGGSAGGDGSAADVTSAGTGDAGSGAEAASTATSATAATSTTGGDGDDGATSTTGGGPGSICIFDECLFDDGAVFE